LAIGLIGLAGWLAGRAGRAIRRGGSVAVASGSGSGSSVWAGDDLGAELGKVLCCSAVLCAVGLSWSYGRCCCGVAADSQGTAGRGGGER
jgi:hypothetical protein